MSFPARLASVCAAIVLLVAVWILGIVFSPQRVAQRSAGAPLVSLPASAQIRSVDIFARATDPAPIVTLKKNGPREWDVSAGSLSFPASADRVAALLQGLRDMRRGNLVTRDPIKLDSLGLDNERAHRVVLHREGAPDTSLLVGKRAASGDEEYVKASGDPSAWLTRSSVGILLAQDRPYWYDLRVLPEDIQGGTIFSIAVAGSVRLGAPEEKVLGGSYTLSRRAAQSSEWVIQGQKTSVSPLAAATMADRLAQLEGMDFAQSAVGDTAPDAGLLQVTIVAINGDRYILRVTGGAEPGKILLTTSWSPWTYVMDPATLARTVLPLQSLLAP